MNLFVRYVRICSISQSSKMTDILCIIDFNGSFLSKQLRGAIDPKRHYKKGDSKSKTLPKYFQASPFVALN